MANNDPRPQYYRARYKLECEWRIHLSPTEERVLSWLIWTTFGWRKGSGRYSLEQMLSGIQHDKTPGRWRVQPIGIANSTLRLALDRLRKIGLLSTSRPYGKTLYTVNLEWRALDTASSPAIDLLGVETAEDMSRKSAHDKPNTGGSSAENRHPYKEIETRKENQENNNSGQTPNGAGYCVAVSESPRPIHAVKELQKIPERLKQAAASDAPIPDPYEPKVLWRVWSVAWRETWPAAGQKLVRWTGRDHAMLKHIVSRWPGTGNKQDFLQFFDWIGRNWQRVVSSKFIWMTNPGPPELPDLKFLSRFLHEFASAYFDRAMLEFCADQPGDLAFYWQLRKGGKSHDEAILEVGTRLALAADRKQREQDLKEAARLYRMADLVRKQTERMPRWTAENPHPDAKDRALPSVAKEDYWEKEYKAFPFAPWDEKEYRRAFQFPRLLTPLSLDAS